MSGIRVYRPFDNYTMVTTTVLSQTSVVHEFFDEVRDHMAAQRARGHDGVRFFAGFVFVVYVHCVLSVHVRSLFRIASDYRYHVERHAQTEYVVFTYFIFDPVRVKG